MLDKKISKNDKLVRIHKDFNRSAIPFYKENAIDFFGEIMRKWNSVYTYEPLIFNLKELKKSLNLEKSNNKDYFSEFILQFAKDTTTEFFIGKNKIIGNAFYFVYNEEENFFKVHLNESLREFLFTQKDIELMKKNKKKQKMTKIEIEEFKQNEKKYKNLMLYSQVEILNFNSKYSKRLYMLLIQFKDTGYFVMKYPEFKKIMEIPNSYKQSDIDKRIFDKIIKEFKEKTQDLEISKINKEKNGGKSIELIEIFFKCDKDRFKQDIQSSKIIENDSKIYYEIQKKEEIKSNLINQTENLYKKYLEMNETLKNLIYETAISLMKKDGINILTETQEKVLFKSAYLRKAMINLGI